MKLDRCIECRVIQCALSLRIVSKIVDLVGICYLRHVLLAADGTAFLVHDSVLTHFRGNISSHSTPFYSDYLIISICSMQICSSGVQYLVILHQLLFDLCTC